MPRGKILTVPPVWGKSSVALTEVINPGGKPASTSPEQWLAAVREAERRGELLSAFDLAERGLAEYPEDIWLKHRAVLALASRRTGRSPPPITTSSATRQPVPPPHTARSSRAPAATTPRSTPRR
jgi:hypothetical protein